MNSTFEDRLLDELKAEITARAAQGRAPARLRLNRRRIVSGAAVVGLAAAAAIAVPMVFGPQTPAYALTKNPDGSINLRINEFRDPDQIEEDMAHLGVPADITYLPLGKRCGNTRAPFVAGDRTVTPEEVKSKDPAVQARVRERATNTASAKAIRPGNGITIYPRHIKPGQIVLIEVMENSVEPSVERPGVAWQFSGRLTDGPVAPCQVVDDPSAFDIGNATPPPGN
ncbi:hypothetical protein [Streptosporangium lutulentum]|uniref:Tat pathway signal sequence domain protein n=1 Tax=Streptosporangium lutulentum TaxID=1461250 RepID=A0ABT9QNX7_9ACTN|nr:hypothetical protein [Streptosporangium lutulentum]MDP9847714.1 hypothetical protein [Streptosporangium lutulentum]